MKKIAIVIFLFLIIAGAVFAFWQSKNNSAQNQTAQISAAPTNVVKTTAPTATPAPQKAAETTAINSCRQEPVKIENYGDDGQRLKNCFVQYPGEPTREDKSYYIIEDICGQFTKEFVENLLGKKIVKTEGPKATGLYNCTYYTDEKNYVMIVLDYLKIENQKIGQEAMGRKTEISPKIPMDNLVVWQEDGQINSVYFVLSSQKFISLERTVNAFASGDELLEFASKLGNEIKYYK